MIFLFILLLFDNEQNIDTDLDDFIEVRYNCYDRKICDFFEKAKKNYQNQNVLFKKKETESINNEYDLYMYENITAHVKVKNFLDIKHCIDFYLAIEKPIFLKDFDLFNTSFITIICPQDDYVQMSEYADDLSQSYEFINVIVDDDQTKGFRVYNPHDKLLYNFDGTLYQLSQAIKGKLSSLTFNEMRKKESLSFLVMNTNPNSETKEAMVELRNIFPKIDFVVPDKQTLNDIQALTNDDKSEFQLFDAKLGIYNSLSYQTLFPEYEFKYNNEDDEKINKIEDDRDKNDENDEEILYDSRMEIEKNSDYEMFSNSYENYNTNVPTSLIEPTDYWKSYDSEYNSNSYDLEYDSYWNSYLKSQSDFGKKYRHNSFDRYYNDGYFGYWYYDLHYYFDKHGNFIGDPYSFFVNEKKDKYYDYYGNKYLPVSFIVELEYDNYGSYINKTVTVTGRGPFSRIDLGTREDHLQNIPIILKQKLKKAKKVYPMNTLSKRITEWMTEQAKDVRTWKEINEPVSNDQILPNKIQTKENETNTFNNKGFSKKRNVNFLNSQTYVKFMKGRYDSAVLYIDNSNESLEMYERFMKIAYKCQISNSCEDLEFAIINTEYNRIVNHVSYGAISLTFKAEKIPVLFVTPQVWYKFVPIMTSNINEIDGFMEVYRDRLKNRYLMDLNNITNDVTKFFGDYYENSDEKIIKTTIKNYESPGKNATFTRSPTGKIFETNDMFYWNIKL